MLRMLSMSLSLVLLAASALAPAAVAQGRVTGSMDLKWNTCYGAPPSEEIPDWIGTVDIDGAVYDMLFFNVGTGHPPTDRVAAPELTVHELWAIYDGLELVFDEECAVETFKGDVVMWGNDYGGANFAVSPDYHMAGTVLKAFGDFADLVGRPIEVSGVVEFDAESGAPTGAPGEIVIG